MTINGNKNILKILVLFSVRHFFQKFFRKMKNGHFKNVQNGKSEKSLEKTPLKHILDHNGFKNILTSEKVVMIIFLYFFEKRT